MKEAPFQLEVYIGGYGDFSFRLLYDRGKLIYWKESIYSTESKEVSVVHPNANHLEHFWKFMSGCREWKPSYKNNLEVYGIEWEVLAVKKFTNVHSSGKDLFPENFQEFLDAVRKLIPGKEFGYKVEYQAEWFEVS